jgi:hypothetical protein
MSDEVGESGNYHTHVYIICSSCITFATLKKSFPTAHIDPAYGTANEVKDYVFKTGKWLEDKKAETNIRDTHFEYGILPNDSKIEEKRIDRRKLYNLVKDGYTNSEILKLDFEYFPYLEAVQRMRLMIKSELSNKSGQESTVL